MINQKQWKNIENENIFVNMQRKLAYVTGANLIVQIVNEKRKPRLIMAFVHILNIRKNNTLWKK